MPSRLVALLFIPLLSVCGASALAQGWPSRPITLIAPSSPGSTPDTVARILAQKLSEQLGQQVVVQSRAGASGNLGSESVAKAAPDGYTLLLGSIANTLNPHMMKGLGFMLDDLAPVSSVAAAPDILMVNPAVPANNLQELIAWLKSKPGTAIAIPGFGSTPHLSTVMLRAMTGIELNIVPYQGGGAVLQGLLGNQVPVAFGTSVSVIPRLRANQLRGLGVTSAKRLASMPDLPTLAEQGLTGFDITAWFGVFAPAKTPQAVIDRLSEETRKALASPDVRKRLTDLGAEPLGSSPAEFSAFVKTEYLKWGKVVAEAGIKAE